MKDFASLSLFFEGNSRIIKQLSDGRLICRLKPTIFSWEDGGYIYVPGIDAIRLKLNAILCDVLHKNGVKTSTIDTLEEYIIMEKYEIPPIEVVVKGSFIGSPKHIYKSIEKSQTRFKSFIPHKHNPYVRFDWRNPLPLDDQCMPEELANYFIDVEEAKKTALSSFHILQSYYLNYDLDLLDICFFMNTKGNVICAEVSTDNCRLAYVGENIDVHRVMNGKDKKEKAATILNLLMDV